MVELILGQLIIAEAGFAAICLVFYFIFGVWRDATDRKKHWFFLLGTGLVATLIALISALIVFGRFVVILNS